MEEEWKRRVQEAMEFRKRFHVRYRNEMPKGLPARQVIVHNRVRPLSFPNMYPNESGFRVWQQDMEPALVECDCGWAPHLERHYYRGRVVES